MNYNSSVFEIDPITEGVMFENIANLENQNFHEVNGTMLGLSSLNPLNSPMRSVMFSSHCYQSLLFPATEPQRIKSGMEYEYARSTMDVVLKNDSRIVANIPKFTGTGANGVYLNEQDQPSRKIITINTEELELNHKIVIDSIDVNRTRRDHQIYGWEYKRQTSNLRIDEEYGKGYVLAKSPRVTDDNEYTFGINLPTAIMSINEITEDGFVISRSAAEKIVTKTYVTISFPCGMLTDGTFTIPLNTYGKGDNYQIMPTIGQYIRDDGLLFASRTIESGFSGRNTSFRKLAEVDLTHDNRYYVPSSFIGGKVVDITLSRTENTFLNPMFTKQLDRMYDAQCLSMKNLLKVYESLKKRYGQHGIQLTSKMSIDVVEAMKELKVNFQKSVTPARKKNPQAEWMIDVVVEAPMPVSISCKMAGKYGNKGVIVDIWDDEKMPVDQWGKRADFIIDGDSSGKRMNWAVLLEHHYHASFDQAVRHIQTMNNVDDQFAYLLGLMKAISPMYHKRLITLYNEKKISAKEYVEDFIINKDIEIPPYCPVIGIDSLDRLENYQPLEYGPVKYIIPGDTHQTTTKESLIIADLYIMFLEKNGTEWSSVSSTRRQHFGLPSKLSHTTKFSMPWREQCMKFLGEAETKAISSNCGPEHIGKLLNRPNDPIATQMLLRTIMSTKRPTDIARGVDYTKVPTNGGRANQLMQSIFFCDGREITRD